MLSHAISKNLLSLLINSTKRQKPENKKGKRMVQMASFRVLVLLLGFSYVLSSVAVPTTRSLKSSEENPSSVPDLLTQDAVDFSETERELLDVGEGYIEGRMDMESLDYPGTGANNHHDPKTPGRA